MTKNKKIFQKLSDSNFLINDKWEVILQIGRGSFGEVYSGRSLEKNLNVAIKLELIESRKSLFEQEVMAYEKLKNGIGIPEILWHGQDSKIKDINIIVMQLLGPSLRDLLYMCRGKFSLKTVSILADQMLSRLQLIHERNIIHQDIKPDNFVMGTGSNSDVVFLIDFGLSNFYRHFHNNEHVEKEKNLRLVGSLKYSSFNCQNGIRLSRRDDLESLGYTLISFLRGNLPWSGIENKNREIKEKIIKEMKTKVDKLCKNLPIEVTTYIKYCKSLKFKDLPDYEFCRNLFLKISNNFKSTKYKYDWSHPSKK